MVTALIEFRAFLARVATAAMVGVLPLAGCASLNPFASHAPAKEATVPEPQTPELLYNHGLDALNRGDYGTAVKQFDAVEENFPYSSWVASAQIMQGYANYARRNFQEAVTVLDRYIQLHPVSRDTAYAYYLRALCYYEQIGSIDRDQTDTFDAMRALQEVVNRYPDTAYGRDARLKIALCRDHLAGAEMEVGRFYERQHLYEAAIGRYQRVVDDFQTTNQVPEALHRLVEIYLKLGLVAQARKTAAVLGYNYPGSPWYSDSYRDLVDSGQVKAAETTPPPRPGFFSRAFGWLF